MCATCPLIALFVFDYKNVLLFLIGPRECLGIQLARMESFLLFTNLFQQFEFKLPPDQPTPSLRGQPGLSLHPHPYHICAIER